MQSVKTIFEPKTEGTIRHLNGIWIIHSTLKGVETDA